MTGEQRQLLRELIDRNRRELLERQRAERGTPGCAGCGCELDLRSEGCSACSDRHRRRNKPASSRECFRCGGPRSRPGSKKRPGVDTGLCRVCFDEQRRSGLRWAA